MKKIFFGFLIAGLVVTGCSENEQSPEEKIVTKQEMIDLNRSHFSAATQLAAVQQYQPNDITHITPTLNLNSQSSKWPKLKKRLLSPFIQKYSFKSF